MLTTRPSLVERLRQGADEESWRRFVALYGPLVERLGRMRGLGAEECDGLVQDFLVRAFEALPRFRYQPARGRFRDWVRTVALNELRQRARAYTAYQRALDGLQREQEVGPHADLELEAWWQEAERKRWVELALERLAATTSPENLAVFRMLVIEEQPPAEVAAFFGKKPGHVNLIKFRLLERLRQLKQEMVEAWDEP